jgi:hypothetical protein
MGAPFTLNRVAATSVWMALAKKAGKAGPVSLVEPQFAYVGAPSYRSG